jgi:hypothetical protein
VIKRAVWLVCLLAFCISCQKFAEGRQIFRDLLALRDAVASEFHEKVVDVNISTGDRLTVKFIDSPLNSQSREAKQKRADEVAAFVTSHYKHPVSSVSTQFVSKAGPAAVEETFVGQAGPKP